MTNINVRGGYFTDFRTNYAAFQVSKWHSRLTVTTEVDYVEANKTVDDNKPVDVRSARLCT